MNKVWRIISTYQDGERILEGVVTTSEEYAEEVAQRVREGRADQDEGPIVTVEEVIK